ETEEGFSAKANYSCAHDASHKQSVDASVTSETTPATCTEAGQILYTATVSAEASLDRKAHSEDKSVAIPATGHEWGDPVYTWSDDNRTVTASRVCAHDESHTETETVETVYTITVKPACTEKGTGTYTATFKNSVFTPQTKSVDIDAIGHEYGEWALVKEPTCTEEGTERRICLHDPSHIDERPVPALGHDYQFVRFEWAEDYTSAKAVLVCSRDEAHVHYADTEVTSERRDDKIVYTAKYEMGDKYYTEEKTVDYVPVPGSIIRLSGKTRYDTSLVVANELKSVLGVDKFNTVILATGENFADALGGGYLAAKKGAPILLTKPSQAAKVNEYIRNNLNAGGLIYVLGGEGAVPAECLEGLEGYDIRRLSGKTRYITNLAILEEAGIGNEEILICTGENYADSLSASAAGRPILLVNSKTDTLNDGQREYLSTHAGNVFYIIGGTGAVSEGLEAEISAYRTPIRLSGAKRYDTAVLIAQTFFGNPDKAVLAYSHDFPDGLCAGPLGNALRAPILLTKEGSESAATAYTAAGAIRNGYICGGEKPLADMVARIIFAMSEDQSIIKR
ncbi:MAG: cell wall-binding repeat-containing protein, partial [Erysipelotrichaceae bacterium]|nr:cell wall-binding repeat-containing protein [Erysipelotrichaceae bacterium]